MIDTVPEIVKALEISTSGKATARQAGLILQEKNAGYFLLTPKKRKELLIECATRGYAIYANAFDIIKITKPGLTLDTLDIQKDFDSIQIFEIKSTDRNMDLSWKGYFFSLSTAELLIAQSLKGRFRFAFVNVKTKAHLELTLNEVFARAKAIYPSWSVRF